MAAVTDVFNYSRDPQPKRVYSTDATKLRFAKGQGAVGAESALNQNNGPTLIQGWNVRYTQNVQELYEVGSANLYWARGHPIGDGGIQRIAGGSVDEIKVIPADGYDACKATDFYIDMTPGTCTSDSTKVALELKSVLVTEIGFSVTVQDVKINTDIKFRFGALIMS